MPNRNDQRRLIVVVEDNPADVGLIEEILNEEQINCGFHVIKDGAKAIEFIERVDADDSIPCPDLLLVDLNLPKRSGEEVLQRLRLSHRCGDAKVLIVSSSNAPADRERAMRRGATDYFRKPSSLDEMMRLGPKVRSLLGM